MHKWQKKEKREEKDKSELDLSVASIEDKTRGTKKSSKVRNAHREKK